MAANAKRGSVRIIGGQWRSRRLEFPEREGLRPTPDRVRETVFNWLAPVLPGARCLDLFAGSGAFGFEALSRAAATVVMVEVDPAAVQALRDNRQRLQAETADIVAGDALEYLKRPAQPFDIVFLDPPYASDLFAPCLARLTEGRWVRPGGFLYLEAPEGQLPELPPGWQLHRSKTAGQVGYHLAQRSSHEEAA